MATSTYTIEHSIPLTQARGTVQLLAARGCFILSGYLISVILARGLGPIDYGVYGVILSVLVWIEMAMGSGVLGATAKLIPQYGSEAGAVEQASRMVLMMLSLALFCVCWLSASAFESLFDIPRGAVLFRLAILDLPVAGMYFAYQGVLHGHRQFGSLSLALIIYSLTKLVGILILSAWELSVSGALVVNVLATVGGLVYIIIRFPPVRDKLSYGVIQAIFRVGFPIGLYLVTYQILLSLDLWSLKSLWSGGGEVIGIYVAALNVAKVLGIVPAALASVLFVSLARAVFQKDEVVAQRYIQEAGRFALILLLPLGTLLALDAEPWMVFLYSHAYRSGGIYLSLQLIAFGLSAFLDIFFQALMAAGKHYQSAGVLLSLVPLALLLNVALIPPLGAMGAAISLVLTIAVGTAAAAVLTYRRFGSLISLSTVARVTMATGLTAIVGTQIPIEGPWVVLKFSGLLGIYASLLSLLKELSWQDVRAFAVWQRSGTP